MGSPPRQRKLNPNHDQCPEWGPEASHSASVYEPWIIGQVTGVRVDESTVERIVRVLSTPESRPIDVNRARLERMKRELALDHAAGSRPFLHPHGVSTDPNRGSRRMGGRWAAKRMILGRPASDQIGWVGRKGERAPAPIKSQRVV
jgi:hypothetical protein